MTLYANNSTYAQALLLIAEAIVGFTFLIALVAFIIVLCCGRRCQSKWPVNCTDPVRGRVLLVLTAVMLIFCMLVWAVLAGFDYIPSYGAALLSAFTGAIIIAVGNLLHVRQSAGDYSYTNATPARCGCCLNSTSTAGYASHSSSSSTQQYAGGSSLFVDSGKHNNVELGGGLDGMGGGGSGNGSDQEMGLKGVNLLPSASSSPSSGGGSYAHSSASSLGCWGVFSRAVSQFCGDTVRAVSDHRERWVLLTVTCCIYIIVAGICITILQGICWCSNPKEITTWLTRKADTRYCKDDQFCHLYPLLGVNSSRMRVVGHIVTSNGDAPRNTYATVCPITLVGVTYTATDPCAIPAWTVQGKVLDHAHLEEDRRYLSHISLINLEPRTYYRATVSFTLASGAVTSRSLMFRTVSAPDDKNSTVKFISGGDMHSSQSGKDGLREALALEPLPDFIEIGGDISYSNNMRYCYLRVDFGLEIFTNLRTSMGTSIPFVFLIGNHESGGYGQDGFDKFYFHQQYFANFDTDEDPPGLAITYHRHILSGAVGLVCLDSDGMTPIAAQNQYLRDSLSFIYGGWTPDPGNPNDAPPADSRLAIVTYHNPAYPSLRKFSNTQSSKVREHWCPILDRYKVPLVLEFHDHAFKRSWPIKGNTIQTAGHGTVYIGDGGLGLDRDVDKDDSDSSYLEKKLLQHNIQLVSISPAGEIRVRSYGDNYEFLDDATLYRLQ